jgi:peptide/nickel transport system substrate-binding protein
MTLRFKPSIGAGVMAVVLACAPAAKKHDVVVYASGTDLESANPLVTVHPLSRQVQRHVLFVTLARYDSALAPQPYYARSWSWSPDHRTLRLHLAPDLQWHDGRRATARDVVFTYAAAKDPRTGFARAGDLATMERVVAISDTVVEMSFTAVQRAVPAILAELPVLPAHKLSGVELTAMRRAGFNNAPLGNGPFRFARRVPGQRWVFERNEQFPASMGGPPRIRQLVIAVVDEPTTKFAGLAAGDLDFAGIAPTMASLAERDPMIDVLDYPVLFSNGLVLNVHRPPFDDVRVRRALEASLNRTRIVEAALAGFGTPASGPVPPENPLALNSPVVRNARLADSLLDAAGWRRGAGEWRSRERPLVVELLTVASGDNPVEQLLQADLAARGIRLEIRQMEMAAFLTRARSATKDFDMLITGIPGDLSLSYLRAMFESAQRGSSIDYVDYHSPALDRFFAAATAAPSDDELRDAWQNVQRELARTVPIVWLYHSRGVQGVASRMRNVHMDLRGELVTVTQWTTEPGTNSATVAKR